MEEAEFKRCIGMLQGEYGKPYGRSAVMLAWNEIKDLRGAALLRAADKMMMGNTHLPPLDRLVAETKRFEQEAVAAEIREREERAAEDKRQFERGQEKVFTSPTNEHAKRSLLLIRGIISGRIPRESFLEGFRMMDNLYPGIGWAESGAGVQRCYEERNLPLSGRPESDI